MRISDWSSDVCSSDLLRRLHMLKRGHGVVRSAPGDYRDTSRSLLDADFYDAIMFLNGHGGAFPRGATGYKRSAVFGDLPVDKGPKSVLVQLPIEKRRHPSRERPGKQSKKPLNPASRRAIMIRRPYQFICH